jgi:hypothetical protein
MAQYFDALTRVDGDVSRAAEWLLVSCESSGPSSMRITAGTSTIRQKRERNEKGSEYGLSSWLQGGTGVKKHRGDERNVGNHSPPPPLPRPPPKSSVGSPEKPLKSYLSVIQPVSPTGITDNQRTRAPPRAAIPLTTPKQIEQVLPSISLEESPLPPEFASALYLTMMEESKDWEKYEWYLAGRLVESGHTSRFFRLREDGMGPNDQYCEPGPWRFGHRSWHYLTLQTIAGYAGKIQPEAPVRCMLHHGWSTITNSCSFTDISAITSSSGRYHQSLCEQHTM